MKLKTVNCPLCNMQILIFIFVIIVFSACKSNYNGSILISDDQAILFIKNDTAIFYYPKSIFPAVFTKKGRSYCLKESAKIGCYDINRRNYEVCLNLSEINSSGYIIQSKDSCINQSRYLSKSAYYPVHKNIRQFQWDSIHIRYNDAENRKDFVLTQNETASYNAERHPFSIQEEAYFMCNLNYGVYYSESTNENPISLSIYSKGKIITQFEGNIIPVAIRSIFEYIDKNG